MLEFYTIKYNNFFARIYFNSNINFIIFLLFPEISYSFIIELCIAYTQLYIIYSFHV